MEFAVIGVLVLLIVVQQVALIHQSDKFTGALMRQHDLHRAEREELLARVSTSERLEFAPAREASVDPDALRYIPDTPDGDDHWNDFRRVAEDER